MFSNIDIKNNQKDYLENLEQQINQIKETERLQYLKNLLENEYNAKFYNETLINRLEFIIANYEIYNLDLKTFFLGYILVLFNKNPRYKVSYDFYQGDFLFDLLKEIIIFNIIYKILIYSTLSFGQDRLVFFFNFLYMPIFILFFNFKVKHISKNMLYIFFCLVFDVLGCQFNINSLFSKNWFYQIFFVTIFSLIALYYMFFVSYSYLYSVLLFLLFFSIFFSSYLIFFSKIYKKNNESFNDKCDKYFFFGLDILFFISTVSYQYLLFNLFILICFFKISIKLTYKYVICPVKK